MLNLKTGNFPGFLLEREERKEIAISVISPDASQYHKYQFTQKEDIEEKKVKKRRVEVPFRDFHYCCFPG